jgi:hypothetical protein
MTEQATTTGIVDAKEAGVRTDRRRVEVGVRMVVTEDQPPAAHPAE